MLRLLYILIFGLLVAGCNEKHRRNPPANPAVIESSQPVIVEPEKLEEATEGFLVSRHTEIVKIGVVPPFEPYAPPGRWVTTSKGVIVWIPRFVESHGLLQNVIAEVETTLPKHDLLFNADPTWISAQPGTRIVILPGHFAVGDLLAAGLTGWYAWYDPISKVQSDVLYVSWRPQSSGLYLPALAHELAHHWSKSYLGEG